MSDNDYCCILHNLNKEIIRFVLERSQGSQIRLIIPDLEPEIVSPKIIYKVEDNLNNPYMNRDEIPLAMDIFKPVVEDEAELPVIVVIHGGGLVTGDRSLSRPYCRALAGRGYLVFTGK